MIPILSLRCHTWEARGSSLCKTATNPLWRIRFCGGSAACAPQFRTCDAASPLFFLRQQTTVNLHHNSRFASQIFGRLGNAQIPPSWSLAICGVRSTPLTRWTPRHLPSLRHLDTPHNSPSQPASDSATSNSVDQYCEPRQQQKHQVKTLISNFAVRSCLWEPTVSDMLRRTITSNRTR